jgi:hypothetical protein
MCEDIECDRPQDCRRETGERKRKSKRKRKRARSRL